MGNKLSARQRHEIKVAFEHFDQDHNGAITVEELIAVTRIRSVDALRLLKDCDIDHNGKISFDEFMKLIEKKFKPVYKTLLNGGKKDHEVTLENMKAVYKSADLEISDKEIEDYFHSIDTNKNELVSLDEFIIGCFVNLAKKGKDKK